MRSVSCLSVESTLDIVDLHIRILRPRLCIRLAVEVHGTHMVIKVAIQLLGIAVASARLHLIVVESCSQCRDDDTDPPQRAKKSVQEHAVSGKSAKVEKSQTYVWGEWRLLVVPCRLISVAAVNAAVLVGSAAASANEGHRNGPTPPKSGFSRRINQRMFAFGSRHSLVISWLGVRVAFWTTGADCSKTYRDALKRFAV